MISQRKPTYLEYIASEEWTQRRERYFSDRPKRCRACNSRRYIQLHHKTYDRMGNEIDSDLVPLCVLCHEEVHRRHRLGSEILAVVTDEFIEERLKARRDGEERAKKRACKKPVRGPRSPAGRCDPVNIGLRKAEKRVGQ